jgi:uncharacterized membrane protein YidH (DUF202 family)
MYEFWLKTFQMESNGGCHRSTRMKKYLGLFLIFPAVLIVILIIFAAYRFYKKKEQYRTPNDLQQYPNFLTT